MTRTAYERAEQAIQNVATRRHLDLGDHTCQEIAYAVVRSQESVRGLPVEARGLRLTGRRLEVLRLAARGLSNAEIGSELGITGCTVKGHVQMLLRDMGARDRAHAVAIGFATGLLTAGDVLPEGVR